MPNYNTQSQDVNITAEGIQVGSIYNDNANRYDGNDGNANTPFNDATGSGTKTVIRNNTKIGQSQQVKITYTDNHWTATTTTQEMIDEVLSSGKTIKLGININWNSDACSRFTGQSWDSKNKRSGNVKAQFNPIPLSSIVDNGNGYSLDISNLKYDNYQAVKCVNYDIAYATRDGTLQMSLFNPNETIVPVNIERTTVNGVQGIVITFTWNTYWYWKLTANYSEIEVHGLYLYDEVYQIVGWTHIKNSTYFSFSYQQPSII